MCSKHLFYVLLLWNWSIFFHSYICVSFFLSRFCKGSLKKNMDVSGCLGSDMRKHANRANLVHRHLCEKMWTVCQNSNKSTTNHTFLEEIYLVEGRNFKISNNLQQMYKFMPEKMWTVQIRKIWFADIFRFLSCRLSSIQIWHFFT